MSLASMKTPVNVTWHIQEIPLVFIEYVTVLVGEWVGVGQGWERGEKRAFCRVCTVYVSVDVTPFAV